MSCLVGDDENDEFTKDWMSLKLINDQIYQHKVLWVNYTTYNVRCDSIHEPSDIMVLSGDDTQPYWYACIIGIFHAMVLKTGQSKS